jgi:hypothetical protein
MIPFLTLESKARDKHRIFRVKAGREPFYGESSIRCEDVQSEIREDQQKRSKGRSTGIDASDRRPGEKRLRAEYVLCTHLEGEEKEQRCCM